MAEMWDYVNFWGPLNDLTTDQRQTDPGFTLEEDAIHTGPIGHAIMAHVFKEELKPDRRNVSVVSARRQNGDWRVTTQNAEASNIQGDDNGLDFTLKANRLPWVLPEQARPGYELVISSPRLSKESLAVADLEPGYQAISIDGQSLPKTYDHFTLGQKIGLQTCSDTPQYRQAARVATWIKDRFEKALVPYRGLQVKMKSRRREYGARAPEVQTFRKTIHPKMDKLLELAQANTEKIYKAAQPEERHYSIVKVTD